MRLLSPVKVGAIALWATVAELPDIGTAAQLGAFGVLAVFFLIIEPRNRKAEREERQADRAARAQEQREERDARLKELQMLLDSQKRGG